MRCYYQGYRFVLALLLSVMAFSFITQRQCRAQDATEPTDSMGIGLESRFASGATPVTVQRTTITPGTPMSVQSTMESMINTGSSNQFGGILGRYDTSQFGKFFGMGSLTERTIPTRDLNIDIDMDNTVENTIQIARMYPPRLIVDFNEMPTSTIQSHDVQDNISLQINNILNRFDFDPTKEQVELVSRGDSLILRGKVRSERLAQKLEFVLSMQAGIDNLKNELVILEPADTPTDLFG
ncbi:MAG: hypothetical protein IKW74_01050, partial [Thermoguttaceae bacterium]|nr:hypothetical protein [Thermoguttaceae bacterium]